MSRLARRLAPSSLLLLGLMGCSCGPHPQAQPGFGQPYAYPMPPSPTDSASAGASVATAPVDPLEVQPVLGDLRLSAVKSAVDSGNTPGAVQALRAAIDQQKPTGLDLARWSYLLGRLLQKSGDQQGAADAFDVAATVPGWVLVDYARLEAASAYAALGRHPDALARAGVVAEELPITLRARSLSADSLDATGQTENAMVIWRAQLAVPKRPARWAETAVKLAAALLKGTPDPARASEALNLVRDVLIHAPTASCVGQASTLERTALAALPPDQQASRAAWTNEQRIDRAEALSSAGRTRDALSQATELWNGLDPKQRTEELGCRTASLKADLLAKDRNKRPQAADAYGEAIQACETQKNLLARVLFSGAKISGRAGRTPEALSRYERVEKEFPKHRLADDARWRSARLALDANDEARFAQQLSRMAADYPDGDMLEDGLFDLALNAMRKSDWQGAITALEQSTRLRPKERDYWVGGRAEYFLARAYAATGKSKEATDLLRDVIVRFPLSYYMAQAFSRLASENPAEAQALLQQAKSKEPEGKLTEAIPASLNRPGFYRAGELLRLGEGAQARQELLGMELPSDDPAVLWTTAALYARAGETVLAFRLVRQRASDWSDHYPNGKWREAWEYAYPRPYLPVLQQEALRSGIGMPLGYGIMREESAFDPEVVSAADAYGLMQLIVPTAKMVARSLNMTADASTLVRPEVNITLGCKLLGDLQRSFSGAAVYAIPSYNAGAGATRKWLAGHGGEPFDLWVESIGYDETRDYTKRVLSSVVAYGFLYEPDKIEASLRLPLTTP